jgi:beta-ribofuranosylaminobenzene 5'-phosphate synthase
MLHVTLTTGSRLHFGPLACGGGEGRRFGGVGMMVAAPGYRVRLDRSEKNRVLANPDLVRRIEEVVARWQADHPQTGSVLVTIESEIPAHQGYGAGTQLALAVADGLAVLSGEGRLTRDDLVRYSGRGERSALGVHGYQLGGFLVDAGKRSDEELGALACRVAVPKEWRLILVSRRAAVGLSGESEQRAFAELPPMSSDLSGRLGRIVLTEVLPALTSGDVAHFAAALSEYGSLVGEYFAPVQLRPFADRRLWEVSEQRRWSGKTAMVQTSWGPTTTICCANEIEAGKTVDELRAELGEEYGMQMVGPLNEGAIVEEPDPS